MGLRASRGRGAVAGLGATAGLVALVLGVPAVLAVLVGWPLPHGLPRGSDLSEALRDPSYIPDRFWIGLAAVGGLGRVAAGGRGHRRRARRRRRPPADAQPAAVHRPRPQHGSAPGQLGHPGRDAGDIAARPGPAGASAAGGGGHRRPRRRCLPPHVGGRVVAQRGSVSAASLLASTAAVDQPVHVVQTWEAHRACLWTIAEEHLGDPLRWREIWELNRDRPQADGGSLSEPDLILPGWQLVLPSDAVGVSVQPAPTTAPAPAPVIAPTPRQLGTEAATATTVAQPAVSSAGTGHLGRDHPGPRALRPPLPAPAAAPRTPRPPAPATSTAPATPGAEAPARARAEQPAAGGRRSPRPAYGPCATGRWVCR